MNPEIFSILILEEDPDYRKFLTDSFDGLSDIEVITLEKEDIQTGYLSHRPHLILLSSSISGVKEGEIIRKIRAHDENIQVILLTDLPDTNPVVNLLKSGIFDFVVKNEWTREHLLHLVKRVRNIFQLAKENQKLTLELNRPFFKFQQLQGISTAWMNSVRLIDEVAHSKITVTLWGEPGTGKSMIALTIHRMNNPGPFVAIDFSAIPPELHFDELFGKAIDSNIAGKIRIESKLVQAKGGTLYLRNISELNPDVQPLLARALQEYRFKPAGADAYIWLDFRVIIGSRSNLSQEYLEGRLYEDLYYRLNGVAIHLPALREREFDPVLLALEFIKEYVEEFGIPTITLSEEARKILVNHDFPGNIRELKSMVALACVVCKNSSILGKDLLRNSDASLQKEIAGEMTLQDYSHAILRWYLKKYNGNIAEVAKVLDIGKSSIYRILKSPEFQKGS